MERDGYSLNEFLTGAMMNCPVTLVVGGITCPTKIETCVNEINTEKYKNSTFMCWDIQNGKLVLYLNE